VLSISFEAAATALRTASAREITLWSPARSAEVALNVSNPMLVEPMSWPSTDQP
jgi:hypothetical protein